MNVLNDLFFRFMVKNDPKMVIDYCRDMGQRVKEIEPHIINKPNLACEYAAVVIKGRWEEAEKNIAEDNAIALRYATEIIKGRFAAYEKRILKDKSQLVHYCTRIKQRIEEFEPIIAKASFDDVMAYTKNVICGRFELAESKIMTKPKWILEYSRVLGKKPSDEMHSAMTMFSFQDPNNKIIKQYFFEFGK